MCHLEIFHTDKDKKKDYMSKWARVHCGVIARGKREKSAVYTHLLFLALFLFLSEGEGLCGKLFEVGPTGTTVFV